MKPLLFAFTCLTLGGCAGMDAGECRGANWYDVGFRDGLFGMQRMDLAYDAQCSRHGTKPDLLAYAKGWQEGLWESEQRRAHGGEE